MKWNRDTEADLQAEFHHHCRLLGINCGLEYETPVGTLDCLVISDDRRSGLAIVECKRPINNPDHEKEHNRSILSSNQVSRYRTLGLPVFALCCFESARPLAKKILQEVVQPDAKYHRPVSLWEIRNAKPVVAKNRSSHIWYMRDQEAALN